LAPSVSALQQILHILECQLQWLDLTVNVRKSACMRIGSRFKNECGSIVSIDGHEIP